MKPHDIYTAPHLRKYVGEDALWPVESFLDGIDCGNDGLERQTRVETRVHFDPYIDGTRNATLYSVWFDENPVFICKTGGRPDREHFGRYITDVSRFYAMLSYLKSLEIIEERDQDDIVDMHDDVADLDIVYGIQINANDLGPIAHARESFRKTLLNWSIHGGWPYPGWPDPGFPKRETITLAQQQEQRWPRLQSEAQRLAEIDPECKPIAEWAAADKGTDDIVAKMLSHIKTLQAKAGCA